MNSRSAGIQVRAWTAVGAMTPDAIFSRLNERISGCFTTAEAAALHRNFVAMCDRNGRILEPEFTTLVLSKMKLSPALTKAVQILFDSLCYLGRVPLQTSSPPPTHLTLESLTRALLWISPGKEQSVVTGVMDERARSPNDQLRIIFQSLASSHKEFEVPLELREKQSLDVYNTTTFPPEQIYAFQTHDMHFDYDGDEMFHDVLDALVSTMPHIPISFAEPNRDAFRGIAKRLHEGAPSLYELVIPALRLDSFLSLLVATSFAGEPLNVDQDLEHVVGCMSASLRQQLSLNLPDSHITTVPDGGTTWPMFHLAISKLLPHLFDSLFSLLDVVFFDGTGPYDEPHSRPKTERGALLTLPRMAQVESLLYHSMYISDTRLVQTYSGPTLPAVSDLLRRIDSMRGWVLLIVSGRATNHESCIFGVYMADPFTCGNQIIDEGIRSENSVMIFQLDPVHDAFRGINGKSAWSMAEEGVTFGHDGHGAALKLESVHVKDAKFTHIPSENKDSTIYRPTAHRGRFEVQFSVEKVELWAEQWQECGLDATAGREMCERE